MIRAVLLELLGFYQAAAAGLYPRCCRFTPSCSRYAETSLERHGALTALRLIAGRLLRCHPLHPGGFDPVAARD